MLRSARIDTHSSRVTEGIVRAPRGHSLFQNRKARNGVNPQTKKKIKIAAGNVPRFRASKLLKQAVHKAKWSIKAEIYHEQI